MLLVAGGGGAVSQAENNPFEFSDTNKRYHTYDYYLKHRFGGKCAKIPLDCGFTCPNIDGKCGVGGCIYCSGGSGARLASALLSLEEQYLQGVERLSSKWKTSKRIPYLQAYSNTYTSPEILGKILDRVSRFEGAVMIDIATRADCLDGGIVEVLHKVSEKIPVTVELGLQSANDETARLINRGHDFDTFVRGFQALRDGAPNVKIGVHIINGLPGENREIMKKTAESVAKLHPDLVKIHLLHVLDGTPLGEMYKAGEYTPLEKDEYVSIVCDQLELLPPDIVVERVTGDGIAEELLAPDWSRKKVCVINDIDKELYQRNSFQGKHFL